MPLSTRTVVALGMLSLAAMGVVTVFGNTILAVVAPAAEVSAGGPGPGAPAASAQRPAAPSGTARAASPSPVDTTRSGSAAPAPQTPPAAGAKDASS